MTEDASANQQRPKNPILYHRPRPISAELDAATSLRPLTDFSFARPTNSVVLGATELPSAMHHYPIVFTTTGQPAAVAVLGLEQDTNLFVNADGTWRSDTYIPAYIRRYPFLFLERADSPELTLCVDLECDRLTQSDEYPLFANGQPTQLTQDALNFCREFHEQLGVTAQFVTALADNELLVDSQARVTTPQGRQVTLNQLQIIDRGKFDALPDEVFLDWRRRGWLSLVYSHFLSIENWARLGRYL